MPTGTQLTIWCADLAIILYFAALGQIVWLPKPAGILSPCTRRARWFWSAGCVVYWCHWLLAFHFFHHWSHEEAVMQTRLRSGFGYGILFSHAFTVIWTTDALWWWFWPALYLCRPRWLGLFIHGYLFFIVFQAAVVFGVGWMRWSAAGASVLVLLIGVAAGIKRRQKSPADSAGTGRAT